MAKPVWRHAMTSDDRRRSKAREWLSSALQRACRTAVSSPAILYMFGIISRRPCDAVKVVASDPAWSAPWIAPAAPPSLCISITEGIVPQMFVFDSDDHWSAPLAHRRRRGNRVDRDHFICFVRDICGRLVTVDGYFGFVMRLFRLATECIWRTVPQLTEVLGFSAAVSRFATA